MYCFPFLCKSSKTCKSAQRRTTKIHTNKHRQGNRTICTHTNTHIHKLELGMTCRQADEASLALTFALTLALTVWMNSKWPPPPPPLCWKAIGRWLKNHWKATSSEVSCVALQLSTTLSPTVTSTRLGLSSTRIASASTKLLHCHPRLTPWMN